MPKHLHEESFQEAILLLVQQAFSHYMGKVVLYAEGTKNEITTLTVQYIEQPNQRLDLPEIWHMRCRDPLEQVSIRECLQEEFEKRPDILETFMQWLRKEGWELSEYEKSQLADRHKEFMRAFPNRFSAWKEQWKERVIKTYIKNIPWQDWYEVLSEQDIILVKEGNKAVIKDSAPL